MAGESLTRTRRYHLGEDGILWSISLPGAEETLADAMENMCAARSLVNGRRYLVLADMRQLKSVEREARAYYARPESMALAAAILIRSPVERTMVNFWLTLNKPRFPVRFFTSEAEAVAWLQGFTVAAQKL